MKGDELSLLNSERHTGTDDVHDAVRSLDA